MVHALCGGLWLHRHVYRGEAMAHLVSSDQELLLQVGARLGLPQGWLQYKPLKHPETGARLEAWHWDLRGRYLSIAIRVAGPRVVGAAASPARQPWE